MSKKEVYSKDKILGFFRQVYKGGSANEAISFLKRQTLNRRDKEDTALGYTNGAGGTFIWGTEYNPMVEESAEKNIFGPFIDYIDAMEGPRETKSILFLGGGGGRDANKALEMGFDVVSLDLSEEMIMFARMFLTGRMDSSVASVMVGGRLRVLEEIFVCSDVLNPPQRILSRKFHGIYAESLAAHLNHNEVQQMLSIYSPLVRKDGCLLLGLRITDSGNVVLARGRHGRRFFTTWKKEETLENNANVLSMLGEAANLRLMLYAIDQHPLGGKRPNFVDCFYLNIKKD